LLDACTGSSSGGSRDNKMAAARRRDTASARSRRQQQQQQSVSGSASNTPASVKQVGCVHTIIPSSTYYKSGVALALRHRLSGLSTYRLNGHKKGDEHPADTTCGVWHRLYLTYMDLYYRVRHNNAFSELTAIFSATA